MLSGCRVGSGTRTVARWSPGEPPRAEKAPHAGDYSLFAAERNPRGELTAVGEPLLTRWLPRGQRFGFARASGGSVEAIVGDERMPLAGGPYLWTLQPDPQQLDWTRTVLLLMIVTVVTIAVIAAAADFEFDNEIGEAAW